MVRDFVRRNAQGFSTAELSLTLYPEETPDSLSKRNRVRMSLARLCKDGKLEAEKQDGKWVIYGSGETIRGLKEHESVVYQSRDTIEERMADTFKLFQDNCGKERREERKRHQATLGDAHNNAQVLHEAKKTAKSAPSLPQNSKKHSNSGHKSMQEEYSNSSFVQPVVGVVMSTNQNNQNTPNLQELIQANRAAARENATQLQQVHTSIKGLRQGHNDLVGQVEEVATLLEDHDKRIQLTDAQVKKMSANAFLSLTPQQQRAVVNLLNDGSLAEIQGIVKSSDLKNISAHGLRNVLADVLKEEKEALKKATKEERSELGKVLDDTPPMWMRVAKWTGVVLVTVSTAVVLFEVIAAVAGFSGLLVKRGGAHAAKQLDLGAQWNSEHNPNYAN